MQRDGVLISGTFELNVLRVDMNDALAGNLSTLRADVTLGVPRGSVKKKA